MKPISESCAFCCLSPSFRNHFSYWLDSLFLYYSLHSERESGIGGTWWSNTYPAAGKVVLVSLTFVITIVQLSNLIFLSFFSFSLPSSALGCDIPVPLYSFSFAQRKDWTTFFALRGELQAYQQEVADRFEITPKIHLDTEVIRADWDEELNLWHVYTRPATGSTETGGETKHWVCRFFCTAVGGLSQRESTRSFLVCVHELLLTLFVPIDHTHCKQPTHAR